MKTLKLPLLLIAMMLTVSISFAIKPDNKKAARTLAFSIDSYINNLKTGHCENFAEILADNVKFHINRNGKILTYGKADALKHNAKAKAQVIQDCEITHNIITGSDTYALVNISMKYPDFTRENIVSLSKINGIWKITEVNSVFK